MVASFEATDEVPAAIALVDSSCAIQRSTSLFQDRFSTLLASHQGEVEQAIAEHVDRLKVPMDGLEVDLSAVASDDGQRYVLVTVPVSEPEAGPGGSNPLLDEPIDTSPAIVWMKGLDGRYLRVNRAYAQQLQTDDERVRGKTDWELDPTESIDGTRLRKIGAPDQDPLELEYTVSFDDRPVFSVLRFAVRDADDRPIAVCGVAAAIDEAAIAESECVRLMRIERLGRLDQAGIRDEILDDWKLTPVAADPARSDEVEEQSAEPERVHELLAQVSALRDEVELARVAAARRPTPEELDQERARAERAEAAFGEERVRAERTEAELRSQLAAVREELERERRAPAEPPGQAALKLERERAARAEAALATERARAERAEAHTSAAPPQHSQPPPPRPTRGGIFRRLRGR